MWGTSGNLSVRLKDKPLEIAITASGTNKGNLKLGDLLKVTENKPQAKHPRGLRLSSDTVIHQAIYKAVPEAQAVFHVHAMYSTLISSFFGNPRETHMLSVDWMEVHTGLGIPEEEGKAEFAIVPNWNDVSLIARDITAYIQDAKRALPCVLIYNHGLTGWAKTPDEARNYLEMFEYVCHYLYLKQLAAR